MLANISSQSPAHRSALQKEEGTKRPEPAEKKERRAQQQTTEDRITLLLFLRTFYEYIY